MRIQLDDQENHALTSNPDTLSAVLLELTAQIQSQGRAIQSISLDGKEVSPESMTAAWGETPVTDIDTLKVTTASVHDLVVNALDEISEVIPELPTACHELAQILASDNPAECFAHFNQFLDIWSVLKERQQQVAGTLGADFGAIQLGTNTALEHNAKLDGYLTRARAHMEASQFAELADLLSHDLIELAEEEANLIAALRTAGQR